MKMNNYGPPPGNGKRLHIKFEDEKEEDEVPDASGVRQEEKKAEEGVPARKEVEDLGLQRQMEQSQELMLDVSAKVSERV